MKKALLYNILFILYYSLAFSQAQTLIDNPQVTFRLINDMFYEPSTERIYAVTKSNDEYSNSLVIINPDDSEIEQSFNLDAEPYKIAFSDNHQYIYIGYKQLSIITRFDIASQTITSFGLGTDNEGNDYYTKDIKVMPENPETIAVVRFTGNNNDGTGGIGIYENGIMRPVDIESPSSVHQSSIIEFKDQNTLIGYYNNSTNRPFTIYSINSTGITLQSQHNNLTLPTQGDIYFIIKDEKVYFNNGTILSLIPSPTVLNEQIATIGLTPNLLFDPLNNLFCIATELFPAYSTEEYDYYSIMLKRYNSINYSVVDSYLIKISSIQGVNKIISCNNNTYAILANFNSRLVIVKNESFLHSESFEKKQSNYIYPNPTKGTLNILTDKINIEQIEIYDLNGKLIISENTINGNSINVNNLEKGLYLIKLTDENKNIYTDKFVKN